MKLVAVVRAVSDPDRAAKALADAGLALAEARMRLAPEPPALVARLENEKAEVLVSALRRAGVAALAVETAFPTDKDRTITHSFLLDTSGITFVPRFGGSMLVLWPDVLAVLRGVRAARHEVEHVQKSKSFSAPAAVVTGGLKMTRTATKVVRSSDESTEQVIIVYARGGRSALLSERELDFSCLRQGMQPSSTANMVELARLIREHAKLAFYDERLLRLGRRPLPFLLVGDSRSSTATTIVTRRDTSASLDVLAEVMWRAVEARLLP